MYSRHIFHKIKSFYCFIKSKGHSWWRCLFGKLLWSRDDGKEHDTIALSHFLPLLWSELRHRLFHPSLLLHPSEKISTKLFQKKPWNKQTKKLFNILNISALLFVAKHSYKSFPIISCCCYQMNSRSSGLSINFKNYMWREYINSVFVSLLNLSANKLLYH